MMFSLRTLAHLSTSLLLLSSSLACKEAAAKTSGVGDSLQPFIIMDGTSGDRYCQVCAYSGKPKIVVFADAEDTKVEADLIRVQKLVEKYADKGLVAFAVFGKIAANGFTPANDDQKLASQIKQLRERLGLTYPVTVVPAQYTEKEKKGYPAFVDAYHIPSTRRVMYGDASNKVMFAESITDSAADAQFEKLDAELAKL
jgi:hypothetical protein